MNRNQYEKTKDYQKAIKILNDFVEEKLAGDIDAMRTICFDDLTKTIYLKSIFLSVMKRQKKSMFLKPCLQWHISLA